MLKNCAGIIVNAIALDRTASPSSIYIKTSDPRLFGLERLLFQGFISFVSSHTSLHLIVPLVPFIVLWIPYLANSLTSPK